GRERHRPWSGHRSRSCPFRRRRSDLRVLRAWSHDVQVYISSCLRVKIATMIPDRAETARRTAPRTILLVEDEPDARTILARRLQAFGWNCLPHASVESALHDPDLRYVEAVVADVVLGEGKMSGIDL